MLFLKLLKISQKKNLKKMKFDIQLNKCWTMKLKKQMFKRRKRKTSKPGEPHEPELISQTCNLLSPTLELDQET